MYAKSPDLSVVIPTFNRKAKLKSTLGVLGRQDLASASFEVVVVDNGSTDGTTGMLEGLAPEFPVRLRTLREPTPNLANAKNVGATAAKGRVLLFIGDDTEPADADLIERHVLLRDAAPENQTILGLIEWTPKQPVTAFMKWLVTEGPQFHYRDISAGPVSLDLYFYGSHTSMKRVLFQKTGGFDGRLTYAAFEDIEYGSRLKRAGATLEYHPELVVWHDHQTTLEDSLARMDRVGRSAAVYNALYPDHPHRAIRVPSGFRWAALPFVEPLLGLLPGSKVLWARHMARYAAGYRLECTSMSLEGLSDNSDYELHKGERAAPNAPKLERSATNHRTPFA